MLNLPPNSDERDDVNEYRNTVFLPQRADWISGMTEWHENLNLILRNCKDRVKQVVFVTHDESTFNSNYGQRKI